MALPAIENTVPDFSQVTELPNSQVIPIQLERAFARYKFASNYCVGKSVLEVACGGGQGLALLAENAERIVGGDLDQINLDYAAQTYINDPKIEVVKLDAQSLPYADNTFDVIILFEAIYYLPNVNAFMSEASRVLKKNGKLIICTANKNWKDFNPSPYSHQYFNVPELDALCSQYSFESEFFGAFPDAATGLKSNLKSFIKRFAVKLGLMPKTMRGKKLLKRIFFGQLVSLPPKLSDAAVNYAEPVPISPEIIDTCHTAIYAVCTSQKL